MAQGHSFLRSAIENDEWKLIRRASADLFTEDELPSFEFVRSYLDQYRELPTIDIVIQEGHPLPALRRPASTEYYFNALKRRFAYTSVNGQHPQLVECLKNQDVPGMLATLREMVQKASRASESQSVTLLSDEIDEVLADYDEARHAPGLRGISTGWETLDLACNGLAGGDLVVLAGRPSMGKSYLLMEMAYVANREGRSVAVTSMEMSKNQIVRRWLGRATGYNPNLIRAGELSTYADERLREVADDLKEAIVPVYLMAGDMRKSVEGIEAMVMEHSPDILFVDSAYLLSPSGRKQGYVSKWESIAEVVLELKEIALRYNIPVVISVQFNRNQKSKGKKELDLGDIAGSDSIPQDASIVLGIQQGVAPFQRTQRLVHVMKNREGDTPKFATAFTFSPVNMREVPFVEQNDDDDAEQQTVSSAWMI